MPCIPQHNGLFIYPICPFFIAQVCQGRFTPYIGDKLIPPLIRNPYNGYINPYWLVVSTHLKNISQIGSFPQAGVKIKNIWNHHLAYYWVDDNPLKVNHHEKRWNSFPMMIFTPLPSKMVKLVVPQPIQKRWPVGLPRYIMCINQLDRFCLICQLYTHFMANQPTPPNIPPGKEHQPYETRAYENALVSRKTRPAKKKNLFPCQKSTPWILQQSHQWPRSHKWRFFCWDSRS